MKKLNLNKIKVMSAFSLLLVIVITIYSQSQFEVRSQEEDVILDYEVSKGKVITEKRKEKNKRFNHRGSSATKSLIKELPGGEGYSLTTSHWMVGLSALPIERADAIVIGTVTNREAYLSEDETNIYTEYELKIEKVFKDSSDSLKINDVFPFIRNGGSVRFKPDKIQTYKIARQGILKQNHRYLMFLRKKNGVDSFIITGYELSGNKVVPIDGQDNKDPKSKLPFDKYLNADVETLLKELQIVLQANGSSGGAG